jgi:signal transduction histidine kinase
VVEDDGCGFDPTIECENGSGDGLKNMETRLKSIGGKTELISHPGKGTKFCFVLPLRCAPGVAAESLN